jgi:5-methylcytosine-specific restriction endonuclease McrA
MTWDGSDRRSRLPENWPALVAQVKAKALGRCQARLPSGVRCPRKGTDVDHIIPGDDHSLKNLRLLCPYHHDKKSSKEGREAQNAIKRSKYRPREDHPGQLR